MVTRMQELQVSRRANEYSSKQFGPQNAHRACTVKNMPVGSASAQGVPKKSVCAWSTGRASCGAFDANGVINMEIVVAIATCGYSIVAEGIPLKVGRSSGIAKRARVPCGCHMIVGVAIAPCA